ncbi:Uncharacterized protein SCF082_LOCUS26441, partial [Durusdinium trenchii]
MSLLSQQAVADAITAVVQASGTAPNNQTGLEEAIVSVRNRIRTAGRVETLQQQKAALSRVLVPLITWLETEPLLTDLDSNTKSDLLWNIYTAGVSRTQAAEAFPLVRSDENQWNDLVRSLTPPAADSTQPLGQENEMEGTLHWKLLVTSLACLAMDAWIPSDRVRFYTTLLGTVLLAVGLACWFRGWTKGPFSKSKPDASRNQAASRTRSMNLSDELPPLEPLVPDQPQLSSVPSGVPPIPTVDQQLGLEASPSASGLTVGTSITLLAIPPYTGLAGQKGIVMACEKGGYSVSLSSGLTLQNVQAGRLKEAVTKAQALASTTPQWGAMFWQAVKNEKDLHELEPGIGNILQSHGYVGESPEQMAWHLRLPADLQRAAPELYRNIRSEGVASVRQWVNDQHPTLELKQTATYQDLFSAATIIDFELADCKSEAAIMHRLGTSDSLEIQLRKLGSYVYYRRTKDRIGANRMLGIRAPGSQTDIDMKAELRYTRASSEVVEEVAKAVARAKVNESTAIDADAQAVEEFRMRIMGRGLLPLRLPPRPTWTAKRSARLGDRQKKRLAVWRMTTGLVRSINGLDGGHVADKLTTPYAQRGRCRMTATAARSLALGHLLHECAIVARARRSLGLTGVQTSDAVASILKQPVDELGYLKISDVKHVPLIADRIAEPACEACIDMLEALPQEDAIFYADEENVVEREGKCEAFFREAESHFGFVGGTEEEYLKYLGRQDVRYLWAWDTMDGIRAIAGVSAVPKKDPLKQRKLVMQVASNYMFTDASTRANLGMCGGAALGGPPALAHKAWHLLSDEVKARVEDPLTEFVSPRYLRLAMGDDLWVQRQRERQLADVGASGYTVTSWCDEVRRVKRLNERTFAFVIVNFFSGERRPGDIEEHVRAEAQKCNLKLLFISIDLATDANWDFTIPKTFHAIMELTDEGLID